MVRDWDLSLTGKGSGAPEVTIEDRRHGLRVVVEVSGWGGGRHVQSIKVDAIDGGAVSSRDVRRAPLFAYTRAALAATAAPLAMVTRPTQTNIVRAMRLPRGNPERGRSTGFYLDILKVARELEKTGEKPAVQIAARKGVEANTVHQWLFRARKIELEARQRRASRGKGKKP